MIRPADAKAAIAALSTLDEAMRDPGSLSITSYSSVCLGQAAGLAIAATTPDDCYAVAMYLETVAGAMRHAGRLYGFRPHDA